MKRIFAVLLIYLLYTSCASIQKNLTASCPGEIIDVGLSIKGQSPCSYCVISKSAVERGFSLTLQDSSYTISNFILSVSTIDETYFRRKIRGNKINFWNGRFLKKLAVGDMLSFECVRLLKGGEPILATTFLTIVE